MTDTYPDDPKAARPEDRPRRFVVLTIDSERFEYRNRHLVIDLEVEASLVAECDVRHAAEQVAAALELHPDPLPVSDEPF
jgi:hypothetical protein